MDPFWTPSLEDLKKYFSSDEWEKLSDYDKKNYINILENYNIMFDLDLNPEEPDFVKAWKNKSVSGNKKSSTELEKETELTNKEEELRAEEPPVKPTDGQTSKDLSAEAKNKKRRERKRKTTASVPEIGKSAIGSNPSGTGDSTTKLNKSKSNKLQPEVATFTQEEVLQAVILDNTVGALYEYCLSDLFKEHCVVNEPVPSTSSGPKTSSAAKVKAEKPDSILKYLADLGFTKEKLSEDHKHIYCRPCQRFYDFFCPRGHRILITDLPSKPSGTIAQFPPYLAMGNSGIKEAGVGVWSTAAIEKGVVWGPFKDTVIPEISENMRERRTLLDKLNYLLKDFAIIKRTWNTHINCARNESERNVMWFKHKNEVYYKVCKRIPLATEILMFYTKEDMEKMGLDPSRFSNAKLEVARVGIVVECSRCSSLFSNARFLLRHGKVCSSEQAVVTEVEKRKEEKEASAEFMSSFKEDSSQNNFKPLRTASENCKDAVAGSSGSAAEPFKCDACDRVFDRSDDLIAHKIVHTGDKPYVCEICSKGFSKSSNLTEHKRIHSGERPYVCDKCSRSFTHSSHLTRHRRIHSGEKPYVCGICSRGFSQLGHLTRHKRTHT